MEGRLTKNMARKATEKSSMDQKYIPMVVEGAWSGGVCWCLVC
jgi:hypothetical protein